MQDRAGALAGAWPLNRHLSARLHDGLADLVLHSYNVDAGCSFRVHVKPPKALVARTQKAAEVRDLDGCWLTSSYAIKTRHVVAGACCS